MDQFVLDKALLSQAQQDEILFALQAVLAAGSGLEKETLAQLTALFHREGGDWLEVDFTDWGSGAAERETFTLVKRAILARRPLSFTYYSSAGEKSRRAVEPARLVFKAGCWYLSAFCQERQDGDVGHGGLRLPFADCLEGYAHGVRQFLLGQPFLSP